MTRDELINEYFDWMCHFVYDEQYLKRTSYHKLMQRLYETDFEYILAMDGNRAEDGIDLRYRFGRENGYEDAMIAAYLDDRPCSVLEMMIALAIRCEDFIMCDSDIGDRTGQWFWNMVVSLGLGSMTDNRFDLKYVDFVLDRFLRREYDRDGKGGLFTVENCRRDLRTVDIWYQMHQYLGEFV